MQQIIKNSIEWSETESRLRKCIRGLTHERDIIKLINNLRITVTELSKAEVEARRGRSANTISLLVKVNQDIEIVEEYILVAALIG